MAHTLDMASACGAKNIEGAIACGLHHSARALLLGVPTRKCYYFIAMAVDPDLLNSF